MANGSGAAGRRSTAGALEALGPHASPLAVVLIELEEPARAYIVADSDLDTARIAEWITRPRANSDVVDALDTLREALADMREAA